MSVELISPSPEIRKPIKKDENILISQWAIPQIAFNTKEQIKQSFFDANQYPMAYATNTLEYYFSTQIITLGQWKAIHEKESLIIKSKKQSKLSTALFAGIMASLIGSVMLVVPFPYNVFGSIALCGPLSVSIYGLKK
jgi:hypothetical protein